MKRLFNFLLVAIVVVGMAACGQTDADSNKDKDGAPATESKTAPSTTPTKADAANPASKPAGGDAAAVEDDTPKTKMEFGEMTHDFGVIDEGDKVSHVFKFKNTGEEPLIINSAKGSCGCTVPEWPRDPIAPNGEGEIKVEFNSKGKKNKQTKTVTINANTDPNPTRLTIKADVTPGEGSETAAAPGGAPPPPPPKPVGGK